MYKNRIVGTEEMADLGSSPVGGVNLFNRKTTFRCIQPFIINIYRPDINKILLKERKIKSHLSSHHLSGIQETVIHINTTSFIRCLGGSAFFIVLV